MEIYLLFSPFFL